MVERKISFSMNCKDIEIDIVGGALKNDKLGEYKPLGDYSAVVPNYPNWNGQIHTFEEVLDLYKRNSKK